MRSVRERLAYETKVSFPFIIASFTSRGRRSSYTPDSFPINCYTVASCPADYDPLHSSSCADVEDIQSVPEGKVNILGGHSICHSKQKCTCTYVLFRTVSEIEIFHCTVPKLLIRKRIYVLFLTERYTRVEAGSNTSTVTLRVVRGDEMGLKKAAP
jgi:hypothetical protein